MNNLIKATDELATYLGYTLMGQSGADHHEAANEALTAYRTARNEQGEVKVKPLALLERRNGYWGGKCSFGYQVAHTNGDLFRVRLHGKVICRDVKGFNRAVTWANRHHETCIRSALEE